MNGEDLEPRRSSTLHYHWLVRFLFVATLFLALTASFFLGVNFSNSKATVLTGNGLLSADQVQELPIGTKVWIQYNHDRLDLWGDEAASTYEKKGVGLVLRCTNGYWELDDPGFGSKWRVWEHQPTEQEQKAIKWEDSPWN